MTRLILRPENDLRRINRPRGAWVMVMEQMADRVIEISLCVAPNDRVELKVVSITGDGHRRVEIESGDDAGVRARARRLAAKFDLVPEWADQSWIMSGHRPPASHYVIR